MRRTRQPRCGRARRNPREREHAGERILGRAQPFALPFATGDLGYQLADGRIFLAGRRDLLVKVRGYRIHLGEIEQAASSVPHVVEAAAVLRPGPRGDATIVVHYVADSDSAPDVATIRSAVAAVVPGPARPTAFVRLPALPRVAGGKVDRGGLAILPTIMPLSSAAEPVYRSALEARVAHLWQDVLQVDVPGCDADFFGLGGDSISVFQVLNRIKTEFGVELSVPEFFEHSVLARLAHAIERRRT